MPDSLKVCSMCAEAKPRSEFFAHKAAADGLQAHCKACHREVQRRSRERNPEAQKEANARWMAKDPDHVRRLAAERNARFRKENPERAKKIAERSKAKARLRTAIKKLEKKLADAEVTAKVCSKCGVEKPLSDFGKSPRGKYGVRGDCKACHAGKARSIYCEMSEARYAERLEYNRQYRARTPEQQRESYRKKVAKRPEKYKALASARSAKWQKKNPDKVAKQNAKRRVATRRIPAWGRPDLIDVVYQKARQFGLEVDHIVPLNSKKVTGLHVWWNLQLLDHELNKAKNNRSWPDMP